MNPQMIKPAARKGRNSETGDLKIFPKIKPKQEIITPVEIVIQKGPKDERRYLWRMSDLARNKGSFKLKRADKTSLEPFPCDFFENSMFVFSYY